MVNIVDFVKRLLPSFSRSELESDMEASMKAISDINDIYVSLQDIFKVAPLTSKVSKDLIKEFYTEFGKAKSKVKLKSSKNFASDTLQLFTNVKTNGSFIMKELDEALNDVIMSQALTAYKANVMRAVGHYYFMTKYALDLVNFFYDAESEGQGNFSKDYRLNKKQKEFITKNMWIYARMLAVYGDEFETFKDKITSIEEIMIPKEEADNVVSFYKSGQIDLFDNLPSGFIGSPIYAIGLVFAEWESSRYRALKDQKKLLELRYLHYKLLSEQGQGDVAMEKEIEHLQKRLTTLQYQISKIEESVE